MLDIQKLAAEMSLTCIATYKLDALKAVRRRAESNEIGSVQSFESLRVQEEKISTVIQGMNPDKACNVSGMYIAHIFLVYVLFKYKEVSWMNYDEFSLPGENIFYICSSQ